MDDRARRFRMAVDTVARVALLGPAAPVQRMDAIERRLGHAGGIFVKRDGLGTSFGASKVRKLEHLLADPQLAGAHRVVTVGARASQHVLATAVAATRVGLPLHAVLFGDAPPERDLTPFLRELDVKLSPHANRPAAGVRLAWATVMRHRDRAVIIPPGGTTARGMVGLVRAAFEIVDDVEAGRLPSPAVLYVALGSCGTGLGLAYGLQLAGLATEVRLVATVERLLATRRRLVALGRELTRFLDEQAPLSGGLWPELDMRRLTVFRDQLGGGYQQPTVAGREAIRVVAELEGVTLDPTYTGKAFAALLAQSAGTAGPILFWNSFDELGPTPERIRPPRIERAAAPAARPGESGIARRLVLKLGAATVGMAAVGGLAHRFLAGYDVPAAVTRELTVLTTAQAGFLAAAAEALLGETRAAHFAASGPHVAVAADRFVACLPDRARRDVGRVLVFLEQAGPLAAGKLGRFSGLSVADREECLAAWQRSERLPLSAGFQAVKAIVMCAYYDRPAAFREIHFLGPMLPATWQGPPSQADYDRLRAPDGPS